MYLMHEELWYSVAGYPASDKTDDVTKAKKEVRALIKICLTLDDAAVTHVKNCKTAEEAWDALAKAYEDNSLGRRLSLQRTLYKLQLTDFKSMDYFIAGVMLTGQQLVDIGKEIDDESLAAIMLNGLTAHYDPLVMALEYSNIQITTDLVKAKLINQASKRSDSKEVALFTKGSKKSGQVKSKSKQAKKIVCYECNEPGHMHPDCPRQSQQHKKFEKSSSNKNCSLLTAFAFSADQQSWFLDLVASVHMTGTKDWLSNFDSSRAGLKITVANNEKLCSTGSDDVQVKVNDKINCISNILHVPNVSTNLLSVSGLVVVFNSTGCHLFRDDDYATSGMVVATASNHQGLNNMDMEQRSHVITAIQPVAMAVKTQADLWHHRFGHLCHYGMNLLRRDVAGVTYDGESEDKCISCLEGKKSRLPFQKGKPKMK
jgi:hypothetical protein